MRNANPFTCWLAYLSVLLRMTQIAALVIQQKQLAQGAYIGATVFIMLMFFSNFGKEAADIVHDA